MGKYVYFQSNFSSGEVGPKFAARSDTQQYVNSARKIENMILMPQGGLTKRPGSRYVAEISGLTDPFLIPFVVSKTEAYVIAVDPNNTASFINIYANDGTLATLTVAADVPVAASSLVNFQWQWAQSADVIWIVHTSGTYPPIIIKRTSANNFFMANFLSDFFETINGSPRILHYPYLDANIDGNKLLRVSATSGSGVTLFAEDAAAVPISFFSSSHVGAIFKLTISGVTGFFRVTAFVSVSQVTGTIYDLGGSDMGGLAATDNWAESAWSNYQGWPRSVCLFEQRLYFGGSVLNPDTIWGSLVGNPFHFLQERLAQDSSADTSGLNFFGSSGVSDPFSFAPASKEVNPIQWLSSGKELNIGTLGAEYIASGGREQILSRSAVLVKVQTTNGSSPVLPVRVNQNLYYISRDAKRLMELEFDFDTDSYRTLNLNLVADHIYRHNFDASDTFLKNCVVTQMSYQPARNILWCVTAKGVLVGITINKEAQVIGWHTHTLGGTYTGSGTLAYPVVTGLAVIPSVDGSYDDIYVSVKRTINGLTEYFLEKIGVDFDHDTFYNDYVSAEEIPFFSDSSLFIDQSGAPSATVTGISHLEGQEVVAVADGKYYGAFTVSSGEITLPESVSKAIVGLLYRPKIYMQAVEAGGDFGSSVGCVKRVDRATAKFYKSYGCKFGRFVKNHLYPHTIVAEEYLEDIVFMPGGAFLDELVLFTGEKRLHVTADPETEQIIIFTQDVPLPLTILGVALRGVTYD